MKSFISISLGAKSHYLSPKSKILSDEGACNTPSKEFFYLTYYDFLFTTSLSIYISEPFKSLEKY